MSDTRITREEYIQRYADQYCNGDVEQAKTHAIVRGVCRELGKDEDIMCPKKNKNMC